LGLAKLFGNRTFSGMFSRLSSNMLPLQLRLALVIPAALLFSCASIPSSAEAQGIGAYIVVDANHKKVLLESEANRKMPIASLTKIATVAVALDWLDSVGGEKDALMVVPSSAAAIGGANPLGMRPGDKIAVRDALYAAMMASDNVSAETLADYFGWKMARRTGGQNSLKAFVDQMNALARTLGMTRTKFVNPHGLDHSKPLGVSTARDMAVLTLYALRNPSFNFICSQLTREISYLRGGKKMAFNLKNTNELLGRHGVDGVKTGLTSRAGQCLITSARRPDRFVPLPTGQKRRIGYRLVTVVLNSPDRFGQSAQLIRNGWRHYDAWVAGGLRVADPEDLLTIP
jgi:D-alanyl-D-alanine carboxypeptidase (penicillin-binding protein 5/6)